MRTPQNIFVDMDGVLAVYDVDIVDHMYNKDYFKNRPAITPMVEMVRQLAKMGHNIYIITSCIDSPYCIPEKDFWLDKNLPEVKKENRIFVPYGAIKADYAVKFADVIGRVNLLIDDYTHNLKKWNFDGALPVKVMNGINGTKGTWLSSGGAKIDAYSSVKSNVRRVNSLINKCHKGLNLK